MSSALVPSRHVVNRYLLASKRHIRDRDRDRATQIVDEILIVLAMIESPDGSVEL